MKKYTRIFKEEEGDNADSIKAIKDLIDLDWSKDEDAQSKALALFKGLVYADTPAADKFIKNVSDYTSGLKVEDFE